MSSFLLFPILFFSLHFWRVCLWVCLLVVVLSCFYFILCCVFSLILAAIQKYMGYMRCGVHTHTPARPNTEHRLTRPVIKEELNSTLNRWLHEPRVGERSENKIEIWSRWKVLLGMQNVQTGEQRRGDACIRVCCPYLVAFNGFPLVKLVFFSRFHALFLSQSFASLFLFVFVFSISFRKTYFDKSNIKSIMYKISM